jgi:hypothetical protein
MKLIAETFTSKEGYLTWRAEWRKQYAELSAAIRTMRLARKECSRTGEVAPERREAWNKAMALSQSVRQTYFVSMPEFATLMLARRKWSKEEAQRQYLAAHEQKAAA